MENAPEDVKRLLAPNERVELYIRQKKYRPKINVDSVVITDKRIILRRPRALRLKKDFTDFNYQDISNVVLDKGLLRSTVKCTLRFGGDPLALSDLPNAYAERAYGIIRGNLARFQTPLSAGYAGVHGPPPPPYQQQQASGYALNPQEKGSPPPSAPDSAAAGACPRCGARLVGGGQKFCGSCGARI